MSDVPRAADVVVIGGGVHGASVAYHLARRGARRVVLVERKFLASGPTGRSSALVRRFYAMDFLTRTANGSADVSWTGTRRGGTSSRSAGRASGTTPCCRGRRRPTHLIDSEGGFAPLPTALAAKPRRSAFAERIGPASPGED